MCRSGTNAVLLLSLATPIAAGAADLDVTVTDVRNDNGDMRVAVVDADGWNRKSPPLSSAAAPARAGESRIALRGLPPGRYAVMVTHDENRNGRLDANLIGVPIEGYGFSNDPAVRGKPTFDDIAFEIGHANLAISVTLR